MSAGETVLHQILLRDGAPDHLPDLVQENISSFQDYHAGEEHRLWTGGDLRDLVASKFTAEIVRSYDRLLPLAYKADLGRLCVLSVYGGIYSDLSMKFVCPLRPPDGMAFAAFRSIPNLTASWTTMSNGIIFSHAGRPELTRCIEGIVRNVRERYFGFSALCPTGPVLFGHVVGGVHHERMKNGLVPDQWIGGVEPDPDTGFNRHVQPDGRTIAMNVKRGRTLETMGVGGTNSYGQLWLDRKIYADGPSRAHSRFRWPIKRRR